MTHDDWMIARYIEMKRNAEIYEQAVGAYMKDDSHREQGATPVPSDPLDACSLMNPEGVMQSYGYHRDIWIWEAGEWTDKVRCSTCGRVARKTRSQYQTLEGTS